MSISDLYTQGDGITRYTDPFWLNICPICGKAFWSVLCTANCIECGYTELSRKLGGVPYEQIIAERSKQIKSE